MSIWDCRSNSQGALVKSAAEKPAILLMRYNIIYYSVLLAIGMAFSMTLFTTLLCHKILDLLHTPGNIYDDAYRYLFIIFLGIPFTILYNMLSALLRAVGNSKMPFVFLAVSTILNVFLDFFCIAVLKWGVAGAAVATIASQALSGFACLIYILKRARILIIKQFLLCPYDAFGTALATFVSQNYGAGRIDRVKKGFADSFALFLGYGLAAGCVMIFQGRPLSSLFLENADAVILDAAAQYLRAMGYLFWILAILNICRFTTQALGFSGRAVFSGVTEMVARVLVSMTFVPRFGYTAVCWTDQCAWVTATIYITTVCLLLLRKIDRKPKIF